MDKKKTRWAGAFVIATAILTLTPALTPGAEVVESKADAATATGITVAAAGDICMDTSALAASCGRTADLIKSRNPSRVFTLGDAQYPTGSLSMFKTWYQPRWGAFKAKTYPATGNHDTFGSGYSTYFDGAAPGPSIPRHYERDLGAWRVVSVDSNSISGARNFVQGLPNTTDHRVFIWHHDPYAQASDHDDITNRRPLTRTQLRRVRTSFSTRTITSTTGDSKTFRSSLWGRAEARCPTTTARPREYPRQRCSAASTRSWASCSSRY